MSDLVFKLTFKLPDIKPNEDVDDYRERTGNDIANILADLAADHRKNHLTLIDDGSVAYKRKEIGNWVVK